MRPSPENRSWPEAKIRIEVSIQKQALALFLDGEEIFTAPVSTAANGTGFEEGSLKTPTGRFIVRERIGEGAPIRTFFKGRLPKGVGNSDSDDSILTRILWLEGLEENNANTYRRYIYFHGTHEEDKIGQPASLGCIRLNNRDMLRLFELTPLFSQVHII